MPAVRAAFVRRPKSYAGVVGADRRGNLYIYFLFIVLFSPSIVDQLYTYTKLQKTVKGYKNKTRETLRELGLISSEDSRPHLAVASIGGEQPLYRSG